MTQHAAKTIDAAKSQALADWMLDTRSCRSLPA
jgi:hypothetical protein